MTRKLSYILAIFLIVPSAVLVNAGRCPPLISFNGESANDFFGVSVSLAGDVNNDGVDDYIIGAPDHTAAEDREGKVYVYSGSTLELLYTFEGEAIRDNLGFSVSAAGDVNSDGYADLLIGAPNFSDFGNSIGKAYVFSGKDGDTLYFFSGGDDDGYFGKSVSSAGDLNNDSIADIIIGSPGSAFNMGRVYVFSGQTGDTLFVFTGEFAGDWFGASVSWAGDIDKDGYNDILVGAPFYDNYTGRAYVFSGKTGDTLYIFDAEIAEEGLGWSVSSAGDVNNDGYLDFVIGAPFYNGWVGRVYVYSGSNGDLLYIFDSNITGLLGSSVASAGDVNNDNFDDIVVGAYFQDDANGSKAGRVIVFSGKNGDTLAFFSGAAPSAYFGFSVAPANDINGDGFDDILIGAFWDGVSAYNAGYVYVYSVDPCVGIRGDVNSDGTDADILDLIFLVDFIFRSGTSPQCDAKSEADINSDGTPSNILDLTFLVDFIFRGGPAPGPCY